MEFISYLEKEKWNSIVKSFGNWDIYYLCEYAISFMDHEMTIPYLIHYCDEYCKLCYVVMLSDISKSEQFKGALPANTYKDLSTPYGYGGPLVEGDFDKISKDRFQKELYAYCHENNIVTQFIRFHPIYQNQSHFDTISELATFKDTIMIDTTSEEIIVKNMDSKNRNMVRKAAKNGITISMDKGDKIDQFIAIYESTMEKNHADDFYYFKQEYYKYLIEEWNQNVIFFYSSLGDTIIGASIFFYNDKFMHYHLSGTLNEYRNLASTNSLLYEAALWASRNGIEVLHLGGGIGAEDSLFGFKKQFNKNGRLPFYIGRTIFDQEKYIQLLTIRKELDSTFDMENSFFIQYRK